MAKYYPIVLLFLCHVLMIDQSQGGTRMLEPPTRASLWRYGYGTPTNNWDDKTDCGGYDNRYLFNNGDCGVCGDASNEPQPRRHEAGGAIAPNPRPVRAYKKGSFITVVMETTSSLFGKFEFRICAISDNMITPEQSCFDANQMSILEAELGNEYQIGSRQGIHTLNVQLPESLVCTHCILQWRHITGYMSNQHSCFSCPGGLTRCHVCQGCGNQVWYVGCTDIAIYNDFRMSPDLMTTAKPPETPTNNSTETTRSTAEDVTTTVSTIGVTSAASQCTCPNPDPRDNQINSSVPYSTDLSNISNSVVNNSNNSTIFSNGNFTDNETFSRNDSSASTTWPSMSVSSPRPATSNPTFVTTTSTGRVTPTDNTATQNNDGTIISPSATDESQGGGNTGSHTVTTVSFDTSTKISVTTPPNILSVTTNKSPLSMSTTASTTVSPTTTAKSTVATTTFIHTTSTTTIPTTTTTSTPKPTTTLKSIPITTYPPITLTTPSPTRHPATTKAPNSENTVPRDNTCYVTNRRRHPHTDMDHWCRQNCPAIGVSFCVYQTCMPVFCMAPIPVNNENIYSNNNVSKPSYAAYLLKLLSNQRDTNVPNPTYNTKNLVDTFNPYSHAHIYNTRNDQSSFGYSPYTSQMGNPRYQTYQTDPNSYYSPIHSNVHFRQHAVQNVYNNPFLSRNRQFNHPTEPYDFNQNANINNRGVPPFNLHTGTGQPYGNSQRYHGGETNVFNPYSNSHQQQGFGNVNYNLKNQQDFSHNINLQQHQLQQDRMQQQYQKQQQQRLRLILQTNKEHQSVSRPETRSNYVVSDHQPINSDGYITSYSNRRPPRTNTINNQRRVNNRNNINWLHLLPFLIEGEFLAT